MTTDHSEPHDHAPSSYAVNKNAADGVPLWCDRCGITIEYSGPDADGLPTFRAAEQS